MFASVVFFAALSANSAPAFQGQGQPIGDSMRRAADETAKFYGRQWQLEGDALRVGLVEPGQWLRYGGVFTKETVSFVFAGQNNTSKLEMNVVDPATKQIVETAELDSKGSIYFMPKRNKAYTIEVVNRGDRADFVTLVQVVGGLGAALPLSSIKFLASSQGHALWDMAVAGQIILPVNTPFLRGAVVPAKGTHTAGVALAMPGTTVVGYGDEGTIRLKTTIVDKGNKRLGSLVDDGSSARFMEFAKGIPAGARIRLENPSSRRMMYSWAVYSAQQ